MAKKTSKKKLALRANNVPARTKLNVTLSKGWQFAIGKFKLSAFKTISLKLSFERINKRRK